MITAQELRRVMRYDPATGQFTNLVRRGPLAPGDVCGSIRKSGYVCIGAAGKLHLAHRLAWLYVHGEFPSGHIDHANGNPTDNRIANLRECTISQNLANARRRSDNTSGHKGVSWHKKNQNWRVRIMTAKRYENVGSFGTKEEAIAAYANRAASLFGEFARPE
jgi:hypothetical protein